MNILVLDIGTSGLKTMIYDGRGRALVKTHRHYSPQFSADSVEMDASVVERHVWDSLSEISCWCHKNSVAVGIVSVTAQRSSVIPVDKNGRPLRKALMWQDKRAKGICEDYRDREPEIYSLCGMKPSPVFSAPKIVWLKRNEPDVYEHAYKLLGFQEFILHSLTGEFVADATIAGRSCLMDIRRFTWSPALLDLFGIDENKLCKVISPGSICGAVNSRFSSLFGLKSGIPVVTAGGDQQCAAVGLGCILPQDIEINTGTGAYVLCVTDHPVIDDKMRVACNPSAVTGRWIVEGSVLSCGSAISWMNREFFKSEEQGDSYGGFDAAAASSPPGANGLVVLPAFCGVGTPCWDDRATAQICNLSLRHKKADFARALLEGIAMEIEECADTVADVCGFHRPRDISCGGGVTKNNLFDDILANTLDCRILVPVCREATALGAWISAAVTNGLYRNYEEAYRAASDQIDHKLFRPDTAAQALYSKLKESRSRVLKKQSIDQHC